MTGHKTKIAEEKRQFKRKIFMAAFRLLCIVTVHCLAVEAEGELSQEEIMALLQKLHDSLSPEQKKMREYQNNRLWAISGDSSEEISGQYWFQRKYFDLKYEIDELNVVLAQVDRLSDLQRQASVLFTEDASMRRLLQNLVLRKRPLTGSVSGCFF